MATKAKPVAVKAPESVVAGLMSKMWGIPPSDTIAQALEAMRDSDAVSHETLLRQEFGFYPWLADVPAQVMSDKPGPLIEHVANHSSDMLWIAKDSFRSGSGGIWLVTSSFVPLGPWRGMFNTFRVGDDKIKIVAVQLESCLR